MKKIMTIIIATVVCCVCFAGCNNDKEEETVTNDTIQAMTEESKKSEKTTAVTNKDEDIHAINNLFNKMMTVYPGSAGCSLKGAIVAAQAMKFSDVTILTSEDITKAIDNYSMNLSDEDKETFIESLNLVTATLDDFTTHWENSKAVLEDAGIEKDFEEYVPNKDKISPLNDALKEFASEK